MYWSVIHGIKREPHLSVVWNWYHWVAIAILHQPRPTDSADINTRLQLSDTSSIPPMHGGFLYIYQYLSILTLQYHDIEIPIGYPAPPTVAITLDGHRLVTFWPRLFDDKAAVTIVFPSCLKNQTVVVIVVYRHKTQSTFSGRRFQFQWLQRNVRASF